MPRASILRRSLFLAGTVALCGCIHDEGQLSPGARCSSGSTCGEGLRCVYDRCRSECAFDRDCPDGVCVAGGATDSSRVCTLPDESGCTAESCPAGLACGADGLCHDACEGTACEPPRVCSGGVCYEPPAADADADVDVDAGADADEDGHGDPNEDGGPPADADTAPDADEDVAPHVDGGTCAAQSQPCDEGRGCCPELTCCDDMMHGYVCEYPAACTP